MEPDRSAGLPERCRASFRGSSGSVNTGQYVIEGKLVDPTKVVVVRPAEPLDGKPGGIQEYIIPDWMPEGSVIVVKVSGANPQF